MTEDKIKPKNVSPLISQQILRKLGMFVSERLLIDNYYLMDALDLMVNDVGEDWLKEEMSKENLKWDEMKSKLIIMRKRLVRMKFYYDLLKDQTFEKKKENYSENKFFKNVRKVNEDKEYLYNAVSFIIRNTDLNRMRIPTDAFKILEHHHFKKIDLTKKSSPTILGTEEVKST